MHVHQLETPSVLINIDRMEANIRRMQAHCDALGVRFRPHVKTHKIPDIARMQMEAGAVGIACQKVSEAEIFAEAGFNDILIPYNILGTEKTARLAALSLYNHITVSADNPAVIAGLGAAARDMEMSLRVFIELATDQERAGCGLDDVVPLAQQIEGADHLHFAGLLIYPSNLSVRPLVQAAIARLSEAGIGVDVVSGGGVGAVHSANEFPELTEMRVGTYVFNDWATVLNGYASLDDCAMHVTATVVSRPTPQRAILDSGSKTLSSDTIDGSYGFILEYPEAKIYRLNEEHGFVDVSACDEQPEVGERVHIVPVHTCVVTNLHNQIYGITGNTVVNIWSVAARGKVW
jgi:D-serine deaminase-like pyridoxal phosphate-dependent protein